MKKMLFQLIAYSFLSVAQAGLVVDDFNRSDTSSSTNFTVSVGSDWFNGGAAASTAQISGNAVVCNSAAGKFLMINSALETRNEGDGTNFTLSAVVSLNSTGGSASVGVAFNWQDAGNFYAVRYTGAGAFQFVQVVDNGGVYARVNELNAFTHVQNRPYEITVTSSDPYQFSAVIRDTVTGEIVYSNDNLIDPVSHFKNGWGGLFSPNGATFDDFRLEVPDAILSLQSEEISYGNILPLNTSRANSPDGDDEATADVDLSITPSAPWQWYADPDGSVTLNLSASSNLTGTGESAVLTVWNWRNDAIFQRAYSTPFSTNITFFMEGRGSYLITFDRLCSDGTNTYSRKPRSIAAFRDNSDKDTWWTLSEFMLGVCAVPERQHWNTNIGELAPDGLSYSNSALKELELVKRIGIGSVRASYVSQPVSYMNYDGGWGVAQCTNLGIRPFVKVPQNMTADLLPVYQAYTGTSDAWKYPRVSSGNRSFFDEIIADTKDSSLFYEVLNESDGDGFFLGTPQECADIVLDFLAARNAGSSSKSVSAYGAALLDDDFNQMVYTQVLAATTGYQTFHSHGDFLKQFDDYLHMMDLVDGAGFDAAAYDYIDSESGYCTWRLDIERMSAAIIVKKILGAWAADGLKGMYIYQLRDTGGSRLNSGGTLNDNPWGLLDYFFCPRASAAAVAGLVEHYGGAAFHSILYSDDVFHCYRFDRSGNNKYFSLINTDSSLQAPVLTITFSTSLTSVALIDEMGNVSYIDPGTSQISLCGELYTIRTASSVTPSVTKLSDSAYRINLL